MSQKPDSDAEKEGRQKAILSSHSGWKGLDHVEHREFLDAHAKRLQDANPDNRAYVLINRLGGIRFVVEKPESQNSPASED